MRVPVRHAFVAALILSVLLMWDKARWVTSLPEVLVLVMAGTLVAESMLRRSALCVDRVLMLLSAAVLWIGLQLTFGTSIYQWRTSVSLLYWLTNTSVFFIGLQLFRDERVRLSFLNTILVFGFAVSVLAPIQALTTNQVFWMFEPEREGIRSMGPFIYANQYAAFIELLLPAAIVGLLTDRRGWKPGYALAAAVMYASIIVSGSRAGFILSTLEVVLIPILVMRRHRLPAKAAVAPIALVAAMFVILAIAAGPDILEVKLTAKDPYAGRREYTESSIRMVRDRPWMGFGLGNWPTAYPAYSTFDDGFYVNQAHNDWAQWAVEGGLPFALIILAIFTITIRSAWHSIWGFGCVAVFLHCLVDYPIQRTAVALFFFAMLSANAAVALTWRNAGQAE